LIDWLIEKQKAGDTTLNSVERLAEMKRFVRGAHMVSWCYDDGWVIRWMLKQARHGFQSIHGNLE
jgi:hypothetical protein